MLFLIFIYHIRNGCHTWCYPIRHKINLDKIDYNKTAYDELSNGNELDRMFAYDYIRSCIVEYFHKIHNVDYYDVLNYITDDLSYFCVEDNMSVYPIFRCSDYPEFILQSVDDIQILKDFVSNGGHLYITTIGDGNVLDDDFNSDNWKLIENNLKELYEKYPNLVIKFS